MVSALEDPRIGKPMRYGNNLSAARRAARARHVAQPAFFDFLSTSRFRYCRSVHVLCTIATVRKHSGRQEYSAQCLESIPVASGTTVET